MRRSAESPRPAAAIRSGARARQSRATLFWNVAMPATSLDDLGAATGMNRPSLYAAFGDKRDLYLKTLERYRSSHARKALKSSPTIRRCGFFFGASTTLRWTFISPAATSARLLFDLDGASAGDDRSGRARIPRRQHRRHRCVPRQADRQGTRAGRGPIERRIQGHWPRSRRRRCTRSRCARGWA